MRPILLFTDFGWNGPYVGQVKTRLWSEGVRGPVIDLMHDVPAFNLHAAGILLKAMLPYTPENALIMAVIDPGVGTQRKAICFQQNNRWFVGPDNPIFHPILATPPTRAINLTIPQSIAATFHGRDIFAPAAAKIVQGLRPDGNETTLTSPPVSPDVARIIYIDVYGNLMSSLTAEDHPYTTFQIKGKPLPIRRTFGDIDTGQGFTYANSIGLLEIAVNCGNAAHQYNLKIGDRLQQIPLERFPSK